MAWRFWTALAVLLTSAAWCTAAEAAAPLAEIYGSLPFIRDAHLSPDGNSIAVISPQHGREALVVWHLDGKPPTVLPTGKFEAKWFSWKTDNRLLASLFIGDFIDFAAPVMETRSLAMDADGGNVVALNFNAPLDASRRIVIGRQNDAPQFQDRVVSMLPDDPEHILMAVTPLDDFVHPDVKRISVQTGRSDFAVRGKLAIVRWLADSAGVVRLGVALQGEKEAVVYVRSSEDAEWRPVHRGVVDQDASFKPIAFSTTSPNILYVGVPGPDGPTEIAEFDTETAALTKVLASNPHLDPQIQVNNGKLIGYRFGDEPRVYVDPDWGHDAAAIAHALSGQRIELIDRSRDGQRVLVEAATGSEPPSYWLLDRRIPKPSLTDIGDTYEALTKEQIAPQRTVSYHARDGLEIPALLTLPLGYKSGPVPFVVLPHGGPTTHDAPGFDYQSQFLARLGYGVLQPQFRGSNGYGNAFLSAGFHQWGLKMQDDVTDGTKWLIEQNYAKTGQIAIAGAGYGGYAALMGAIREPALYRCVAALAPITDLPRLVANLHHFLFRDINIPRIKADGQSLDETSPVDHADKIQVPVLLVHGRKDFNVEVEQSEDMERALKDAKKPVQALYLDEADHYLSHADDRVAYLRALESFLKANLPPVAAE